MIYFLIDKTTILLRGQNDIKFVFAIPYLVRVSVSNVLMCNGTVPDRQYVF